MVSRKKYCNYVGGRQIAYTRSNVYSGQGVFKHACACNQPHSLSLSSSLSLTHTYFTPMERSHTFGQLKRSIFSTLSIRILDWCCKISWLQFGIILGSRLLPYFIEYSAHCTSTYSAHLNFANVLAESVLFNRVAICLFQCNRWHLHKVQPCAKQNFAVASKVQCVVIISS